MMNLASFSEIKEIPVKKMADCALGKLIDNMAPKIATGETDRPLGLIHENMKNCPIEGNNGHWEGERGNSKFIPNRDDIPLKANPEGKTWGEIVDDHGIDGIEFKEGEPGFSEISKDKVEIKPFSDSRTDNFDKADIELAEKLGSTPDEVAEWRKENGYTWHECRDMKTMELVPSEVHNNISHSGGISEAKKGTNE